MVVKFRKLDISWWSKPVPSRSRDNIQDTKHMIEYNNSVEMSNTQQTSTTYVK